MLAVRSQGYNRSLRFEDLLTLIYLRERSVRQRQPCSVLKCRVDSDKTLIETQPEQQFMPDLVSDCIGSLEKLDHLNIQAVAKSR